MSAAAEGVPGGCEAPEGSESPGTPPEELPRVRRQRGRFLVWAPAAARTLRERHRVWGALVGTPPRRGRSGSMAAAASGPRLPLELRPEEARVLRESGGAAVEPVGADEEAPAGEGGRGERRFRLYRELWGRGLHVTPGGKFGGDFLVYPGPPSQFHACAVALCPRPSQPQPLGALLAGARLGTSVRKTLLLCSAPPGGALTCTALQWRGDLA